MSKSSAKLAAARKVDIGVAINHLEQALVEARMVAAAGPNNAKRQNVTNAKAHAMAAESIFVVLQSETLHEH